MISNFNNKNVVITGGAGGVGSALGRAFLNAGCRVALLDMNEVSLEEAKTNFKSEIDNDRVLIIKTDITDDQSVESAADTVISKFGNVHILVNNAGIFLRGIPAGDIPIETWQSIMDVNFFGAVRCVHYLLPNMKAHGEEAQIVNVASVSGFLVSGERCTAAYAASKFALVAFSEALAGELADTNIGVCVVAPAAIATNIYPNSAGQLEKITTDGLIPEGSMKETPPDIAAGMQPSEAAEKIVSAVRSSKFYIMTHPEVKTMIKERHDKILEAFE